MALQFKLPCARSLVALVLTPLVAAPQTGLAARALPTTGIAPFALSAAKAPEKPKYTAQAYESLKNLIETTPLESMDLKFFTEVYGRQHAPEMLKRIFGSPELEAKSSRLGELRKFYDWGIQADWARQNHAIIENTNQGKDNGARSDLDATANVLEFDPATGEWVIREKAVAGLIEYQRKRYLADVHFAPEGADVTLFNGDVWLPDWRDARMSYHEFKHQLVRGVWDTTKQKAAYSVPGANLEQTRDRALREGRTVHIGWDYVAGKPSVNGFPIDFDPKTGRVVALEFNRETGKYRIVGPVPELSTREEAGRGKVLRYSGVEAMPPSEAWRRAFGNAVENAGQFLKHANPVDRNKYFIERIIDQGAGRFTHLEGAASPLAGRDPNAPATYVEIHGASGITAEEKAAWKKSFVEQAFGLREGDPRAGEIQKVLDRAAEIQLDKTKKRRAYGDGARHSAEGYYFADEWAKAQENTAAAVEELKARASAEGKTVSDADITRLQEHEAERLFFEKQRRVMIEATLQVAKETFKRDFPEESHVNRDRFSNPEIARKSMFTRGVELAQLMELIETAPEMSPVLKEKMRAGILEAIPQASRPLATKLAEVIRLKLGMIGGFQDEHFKNKPPSELWAEVEEELKSKFPESEQGAPMSEDFVRDKMREMIRERLGPVEAPKFEEAWTAGKRALIAKFGAKAYWKEITEQADFLMATGAALGLVNAYQEHCIGQTSWNEECVTALAGETGNQVLFLLPGINSGWMILGGLKAIGEGHVKEGATSFGLGVFSLPPVAGLFGVGGAAMVHLYVGYQILKLGVAVTYGYAVQTMDNDAVEQAFKALREPGKQARPYPYGNRSSLFSGDTPTIPLLADVITGKDKDGRELVPADSYDDARRNNAALEQSAPAIQSELQQTGLKPDSPEWEAKRREIIVRTGALMPYLQRSAKIYQVLGPKVEAKAKELGTSEDLSAMRDCLEFREDEIEAKYKEPPSLTQRLRFWADPAVDKQRDLGAAWSTCVDKASKQDEAILTPFFDDYLDHWFALQSDGYREAHNTPEMRGRLRSALIREYVVHRHLDGGYEAERQMKRAAARAKEGAKTRVELMSKIMRGEEKLASQVGEGLKAAAEKNAPAHPEVKPQLVLRAPPHAVRIGQTAFIDFSVRGQYYKDEPRNDWKANLEQQVVKIRPGAPENLILTRELEAELQAEPGQPAKQLVTVEEKLTGVLKDGTGAVLATAEALAVYYDVVEWEGVVQVETRAANADSADPADPKQSYAYPGAMVRLSGPSQDQKQSELFNSSGGLAGVVFKGLPEGKFTVHVEPKPGDTTHRAADVVATLTRAAADTGQPEHGDQQPMLRLGKDRDFLVVVLPGVPAKPPSKGTEGAHTNPPPGHDAGPALPPQGAPGAPAAGIQKVADCQGLIGKARAALAHNGLAESSSLAAQAQQMGCGGVPGGDLTGLLNDINQIRDQQNTHIRQLETGARNQAAACNFDQALALARELADADPGNAWLSANLTQLEKSAAEQARIRNLLSVVAAGLPDNDVKPVLAELQQALTTAPACMAGEINIAIQQLVRRLGQLSVQGLTDQIRALFAACDYVKALALAQQLQAANPADPWLATNFGVLQSTAAEQSAAQMLIRAAHQAAPESDTSPLVAQLERALGTAPFCMADQIHAAIAGLTRPAGQKPTWLDAGQSKPASGRDPNDVLQTARDILNKNETDEINRQKPPAATSPVDPGNATAPAVQPQNPAAPAAPPNPQRRSNGPGRAAQIGGSLLQNLPAILGNRGKLPIPIPSIPSGGGASGPAAGDALIGTWVGYGAVTAHRDGNDKDKGSVVDARVNPRENQVVFRILKSGTGYVFENFDGRRATIRYVNGNRIGTSARINAEDGRYFNYTGDYEANGGRMTGTQRAEGQDGSLIVMSVTLTRQ